MEVQRRNILRAIAAGAGAVSLLQASGVVAAKTPRCFDSKRMASRMSYLKNFITDADTEAAWRKFRELRDKRVTDHPDEMKQPKLGNADDTVWWMYQTKAETLQKIQAGGLKPPTVIIWGMNDTFAPLRLGVNVMQTVTKVVDRAEFHVINHCGHFVASEHPAKPLG